MSRVKKPTKESETPKGGNSMVGLKAQEKEWSLKPGETYNDGRGAAR